MGKIGLMVAMAAVLAMLGVWSDRAFAQNYCTAIAFAQGTTSATVTGRVRQESADCYTVQPATGQIGHVAVTGANTVVTVSDSAGKDMGHPRAEWSFTTKATGYTLTVSQKARSAELQPYSLTVSTTARPRCGLAHLDLCAYGNSLANDPDFRTAVAQFLGTRRGFYLFDGQVVDQMFEVLNGHADDLVPINGLYRFTACRQRDCADKGAAVVDIDGHVVALGIVYGTCSRHVPDCMGDRRLTVFIKEPEAMAWAIDDMADWAKGAAAQTNMVAGPMPSLRGINVVRIE